MYYIYEYIDPRTNLPFYIGKGKKNRKFNHIKNEKESKHENADKFNIIQEIISTGLYPIVREIESNIQDEKEAYKREDFYILKYGRRGIDANGILTNKTLHGHPPTPVWDDQRKNKHSEWNAKYWTEERKAAHQEIAKQNAVKGGLASKGTVAVVDRTGNTKRIPKDVYLSIDKNLPIDEQEYVSTASKEGKKRLSNPTLGPLVATEKGVRAIELLRDSEPRIK